MANFSISGALSLGYLSLATDTACLLRPFACHPRFVDCLHGLIFLMLEWVMQGELSPFSYTDEPLEIALEAISSGSANVEALLDAAAARRRARPPIGEIALRQRKLTMAQVFRVLEQQPDTDELFGAIAIRLGFLTEASLRELLQLQTEMTPSLVSILTGEGVLSPEQAAKLQESARIRLRCNSSAMVLANSLA
jgi:hypothetical protein